MNLAARSAFLVGINPMGMRIWAMNKFFTRIAGRIAFLAGKPATFILAAALVLLWAATGPLFAFSEVWQLVINTGTTIITFLMVFLVQNTQNRDACAMQAKLDELLRAMVDARAEFIGIEHLTDTEIEAIRSQLEKDQEEMADRPPPHASVGRLLARR
jgi:low affinity Fe/Cu permease